MLLNSEMQDTAVAMAAPRTVAEKEAVWACAGECGLQLDSRGWLRHAFCPLRRLPRGMRARATPGNTSQVPQPCVRGSTGPCYPGMLREEGRVGHIITPQTERTPRCPSACTPLGEECSQPRVRCIREEMEECIRGKAGGRGARHWGGLLTPASLGGPWVAGSTRVPLWFLGAQSEL